MHVYMTSYNDIQPTTRLVMSTCTHRYKHNDNQWQVFYEKVLARIKMRFLYEFTYFLYICELYTTGNIYSVSFYKNTTIKGKQTKEID